MKIYTKTGDMGETGLFGGPRVSKASTRVEAYGTVDELNAVLGMARATRLPQSDDQLLAQVQNHLFDLGAQLATPDPSTHQAGTIDGALVHWLETLIDEHELGLSPLKGFILPGGSPAAAALHLARCVCRRAERLVVRLAAEESVSPELVRYLNRLGDLLFVLARSANHAEGVSDEPWHKRSDPSSG